MAVAAKTPTPEQLKAYADSLPEIYRRVLRSFHMTDPERRYGDGIAANAFWSEVLNSPSGYTRHDYRHALGQLQARGFLAFEEEIGYWRFTDLGEALLGVVVGGIAPKVTVPDLPDPKW
jgi:hypothetical protein